MVAKIKNLMRWTSVCLNCGSLNVGVSLFCPTCYLHLTQWYAPLPKEELSIGGLKSWTLFQWHPNESDSVSRLILSLKKGRNRAAWGPYAKEFVRRFLLVNRIEGKKVVFVPAPSRSISELDHAYWLAHALHQELGGHIWRGLRRDSDRHQRESDRGERALLRFSLIENSTWPQTIESQTLWIFVDDIVTTGATARAVHNTLGRPENFMVWALARRMLACDA